MLVRQRNCLNALVLTKFLSKWDIANATIFDAVRKEGQTKYRLEEEVHQAHKGVRFSENHKDLVL